MAKEKKAKEKKANEKKVNKQKQINKLVLTLLTAKAKLESILFDLKAGFPECKIHLVGDDGTSAHVKISEGKISYFSGGSKHEEFVKIFTDEQRELLMINYPMSELILYGEAYVGVERV